ncbi:hypothetical protein ASD04_07025 [Devosia sp. Root436]|uniref:hypothetical protein n=1 Tax=Devosia sp. Root436 TaxID=1736537 RepID=UPI0006F88C8D|nr:hypothetical protein [Devosia sp. Root436]KQX40375.1 hypothetical protein ASD04_07025 [Devosia sp. Root436]
MFKWGKKPEAKPEVERDPNLDRLLVGEYRRLEDTITEKLYAGVEPFRPVELRFFCISAIVVLIAVSVKDMSDEEKEAEARRFFEFGTFEIFSESEYSQDDENLPRIENSFAHRHSIYGDPIYSWLFQESLEAGLVIVADLDHHVWVNERSGFELPAALRELQNALMDAGRVLHAAYRAYPPNGARTT